MDSFEDALLCNLDVGLAVFGPALKNEKHGQKPTFLFKWSN